VTEQLLCPQRTKKAAGANRREEWDLEHKGVGPSAGGRGRASLGPIDVAPVSGRHVANDEALFDSCLFASRQTALSPARPVALAAAATHLPTLGFALELRTTLFVRSDEKGCSMKNMSRGNIFLLAILLFLFGLTGIWMVAAWNSAGDVEMSRHGWIAMGLGTVFSIVIGCGLMALMFYSSRSGHDDAADPFRRKPRPPDE
jgi:hypothetical protein